MAICKIIPITQSGGIKDCWEYITDEEKVISIKKKDGKLHKTTIDPSLLNMTAEEYMLAKMDFNTVLAYMENDEKTHRPENIQEKYISGYLCTPETAVQEFMDVKEQNLLKQNKTLKEESGNYAYHIIQSFPEDLNISDDEVHQCGRELCEKLHAYQAVICSHVHPVINEEGEVTGRCKHNHILINSHIHPDMLDPEKPNIYKYHDCKETYAQLQKWNDEISLSHGLPIIREKKNDKQYRWLKTQNENQETSWTKQVARDIKNTMRFCTNWEEFKAQMTEQGYYIRETPKTITYYTPEHTENHKQRIRENKLDKGCSKSELERYWRIITTAKDKITQTENKKSQAPLIEALIKQYDSNLFAEVLCKNKYNAYYLDVPLRNTRREVATETLYTYFDAENTYKLITEDHNPIAEVTGQDIFDYYELLKKKREKEQEEKETTPDNSQYYYDNTKLNSKTYKPYKISLWDNNGRRRTTIELVCILAMVIIKKEHSTTQTSNTPNFKNKTNKYLYAKTDWKLQNMYNTMLMAKEMNLENSADIERKLDRAGKEIARKRKQLKSLTETYNQMKTINDHLKKLESVKDICEQIYNMPDGSQKDAALETHTLELEQYKTAKRYLHTKNINTDKQINDFKYRFEDITEHLNEIKKEVDSINKEYKNLKKIQYNLSMAQNDFYCYGPDHRRFAEQPKVKEDKNSSKTEEQKNIKLE